MLFRQLLAAALACSLAADPTSARVAAVGFVSHAEGAYIGDAFASVGASIYDGDRLSTEAGGSMRLTIGTAALHLAPQTSLTLHLADSGHDTDVELAAGILAFAAAKPPSIAVRADSAWIHCGASFPVAAQIRVVNTKELQIRAQRGSLELTYKGESAVIPEGLAYRVLLDPDDEPADKPANAKDAVEKPAKPKRPFLLIAIVAGAAAAAAASIILLNPNYESPDRPGTVPH